MIDNKVLLKVNDLRKYFLVEKGILKKSVGTVKAVDDVSITIMEGETYGLVGESGCGKTTFGRCILRGIEPTSGEILLDIDNEPVDLNRLDKKELRATRRYAQMIFQDPYASLDPRMTVLDIVGEPLKINGIAKGQELKDMVIELVRIVGLEVKYLNRYPHAFSGGQRQRIGIARALATKPKLIIADEAVSALDVSVQAQILNLLQKLQQELGLTYLFISHDLSVIQHISDRVGVMYVGKLNEEGKTEVLFQSPAHPYTEALLSAIPKTNPEIKMDRIYLPGDVANPADPPSGCYFHPRCQYAKEICRKEEPAWKEIEPEHFVSCHFSGELKLRGV
ncbi:MAG: ATP-binding cassette domain-containing protein [Spirochaetales bacterium]|nr:ATP-binding cassette domain-containing protein [Spirochaetales bacterium]